MEGSLPITDNAAWDSAIGSSEIVTLRNDVPGFEVAFKQALDDEGPEMGAFQAMSVFASWLEGRIEQSPKGPDVRQAFRVVEAIATTDTYPLGRELVAEFVEALWGNPTAIQFMGPETLRWT